MKLETFRKAAAPVLMGIGVLCIIGSEGNPSVMLGASLVALFAAGIVMMVNEKLDNKDNDK